MHQVQEERQKRLNDDRPREIFRIRKKDCTKFPPLPAGKPLYNTYGVYINIKIIKFGNYSISQICHCITTFVYSRKEGVSEVC